MYVSSSSVAYNFYLSFFISFTKTKFIFGKQISVLYICIINDQDFFKGEML